MTRITALVVDDEPLARMGLKQRLSQFPEIDIVALCQNGREALQYLLASPPDVVFMDVQMPGLSGLEVLAQLQAQQPEPDVGPRVIMTTAHSDFAHQAFEHQVFDYLLKPYTEERLLLCINKIKSHMQQCQAYQQQQQLDALLSKRTGRTLQGLIDNLERQPGQESSPMNAMISLKSGSEWLRIAINDITWIEAAGDYMCVHTEQQSHIVRTTMKQLCQELSPKAFPRVNRSAMVNLSKVIRLTPNSNGEYLAHLNTGAQVKVTRKYKFKLEELTH